MEIFSMHSFFCHWQKSFAVLQKYYFQQLKVWSNNHPTFVLKALRFIWCLTHTQTRNLKISWYTEKNICHITLRNSYFHLTLRENINCYSFYLTQFFWVSFSLFKKKIVRVIQNKKNFGYHFFLAFLSTLKINK